MMMTLLSMTFFSTLAVASLFLIVGMISAAWPAVARALDLADARAPRHAVVVRRRVRLARVAAVQPAANHTISRAAA